MAAAVSYPKMRSIELPSVVRPPLPAAPDDRLWCVVCERTFHAHQQRDEDGAKLCPYFGCEGGRLFEPWSWAWVRQANPHYPVEPLEDVSYPYFGREGEANRSTV